MKHKWCRIEQRQNSESFGDQLNQARKWWEQCNSFPEPKIGSPCCFTWGRMTRVVVLISRIFSGLIVSRVFSGLLISRVFSGLKIKALVVLVLATMATPAKALCPQFCQVWSTKPLKYITILSTLWLFAHMNSHSSASGGRARSQWIAGALTLASYLKTLRGSHRLNLAIRVLQYLLLLLSLCRI